MPSVRVRRRRAPSVLVRRRPVLTAAVFIGVCVGGLLVGRSSSDHAVQTYGLVLGALLTIKLVLSLLPVRPLPVYPPAGVVGVVIPIWNEDEAALRACLASLEVQTRAPDVVVLVDDGSTDRAATIAARQWAAGGPDRHLIELPANVGKRHAQAVAFRGLVDVDVWVTVDSDTVLGPDAIRQGLRPFHDPAITAVTGTVLGLNSEAGLLPALIDLRYTNAFLGDRAAQSRLGTVLCCCGSLSFWRGTVIRDNLDDWLGQQFLGRPATFGDDRRLTRYALEAGKVVLSRQALGFTAVPVRLDHYIRQQARWGRSFWRESWLMLRSGRRTSMAWWWTVMEVFTTIAFSAGMLLVLLDAVTGNIARAEAYLAWVVITSWARSVHMFTVRRRRSVLLDIAVFLVAPLYGLFALFVLLPLRLYSLCTLSTAAWGTRSDGVEVSLGAKV